MKELACAKAHRGSELECSDSGRPVAEYGRGSLVGVAVATNSQSDIIEFVGGIKSQWMA